MPGVTEHEIVNIDSDGRAVYVVADDRAWPIVTSATPRPLSVVDQARIAGRTLLVGTTAVRP